MLKRLTNHTVVARQARNKETVTLLDDQMIELTDRDIVIADGKRPVALAGIMGGKETAVRDSYHRAFCRSSQF